MNEQKQQLVEKLKAANNILVTVRNNPTVDLLSACIGLTIILNKLDKHATAVFSGEIPSTMEFLKPEDTLEKNTDSLRDFIIALDKSKADKLRYKVEDKSVRIFITPYKTSISQDDLDFSQGDFNVDVVVALGAHEQQELDQAITQHGRILHDATVTSINNANNGNLGSINWQDTTASSLSELVAILAKDLSKDKDKPLLDEQVATALLTGIVAETDRFSNSHTTATTMSVSAELMAAGANQQLVATQLQAEPAPVELPPAKPNAPKDDNGTLEIAHEAKPEAPAPEQAAPETPSLPPVAPPQAEEASIDEPPKIKPLHEHDSMLPSAAPSESSDMAGIGYAADQGSMLTANTQPEPLDGAMESFAAPQGASGASDHMPLLSHDYEGKKEHHATASPTAPPTQPDVTPTSEPSTRNNAPVKSDTKNDKTLSEIEQDVHSPHAAQTLDGDIDSARDEVLKALQETPTTPEPITALNAQPALDITHDDGAPLPPTPPPTTELHVDANGNLQLPSYPPAAVNEPAPNPLSPADQPLDMPLPPSIQVPPPQQIPPTNAQTQNPNAPPPVPPPMLPPM